MSTNNLECVSCEPTPLGLICLWQRVLPNQPGTLVTELTLDHEFLMSSHVNASERALVTKALDRHPGRGLQVLVGGLGLGYTAIEALDSERVARVDVVEYLPPVISWLKQGLLPTSDQLKSDARLSVIEGDVYEQLASSPETKYDLILIDVDHSPERQLGGAHGAFYTEAGLNRAQQHLAPGGILGVWSYADHSAFADALSAVFKERSVEPVTIMNEVTGEEQTDFLFLAWDPRTP